MSTSQKYPDLYGIFIKVFKKKVQDLDYYASTHYLTTSGKMFFYIRDKKLIYKW